MLSEAPNGHIPSQCPFSGIDESKMEKIPVPPMKYFGLMGHLPDIDPQFPASSLWKMMDENGPIFEADLRGRRIVVGNHSLFAEMMNEDTWIKRPSPSQLELRNVGGGDGLLTAYSTEKNWGIARRLLNPAFGQLGLREMFDDMVEIGTQLVLMWDRQGPEEEIECVDAFSRLTFDTIGLCAFKVRFNEFYMRETHPFVRNLAKALIECGRRANRPAFLNSLLHFRAEKERQANAQILKDMGDKIMRDWELSPKSEAGPLQFMNVLMNGVDKVTGEKLPIDNIPKQICTFLGAGYETTAASLSFLYFYLCDHPECLRKAQQEVDDVVGDKVVTPEMLPRLEYLKACIKESLRLNTPINVLSRDALHDTVLGGKYKVEKGKVISCLMRHVQRDPTIWGEDANEFRPERMLDGRLEALPPTAWKPFGSGIRVCIGQGFSEQEMLINLCQVLQRFEVSKADPDYELSLRSTLTVKPDNFRIKVKRRPGRSLMVGIPGGKRETEQQRQARHRRQKTAASEGDSLKPISVFVGGNMGTAEGLGHDLAERALAYGLEVEVKDLDDAVDCLSTEKPSVIITASYEGKPPDNARKFITWIEKKLQENTPFPKGTRFATFALGNSDWSSSFHRIPELVDGTMGKLDGERIQDMGRSNVKLDLWGPWEDWSEKLCAVLSGAEIQADSQAPSASVGIDISIQPHEAAAGRRQTMNEDDMCNVTVLNNRQLSDTSMGAAKRHLEVRLPAGTTFVPGDYILVQGRNSGELVRRVLERFELGKYDMITIKASKKTFLPEQPMTVGNFLSTIVELATPVTRRQLATIAQHATNGSVEQEKLTQMQTDAAHEISLEKRISIIDVLDDMPSLKLPFGVYVDMLLPLAPRQYSISTSPLETRANSKNDQKEDGLVAGVTFDVLESPALSGHGTFRGVVSSFLSSRVAGDRIRCVVRGNSLGFHLPAKLETPVIMIAAGTGISPIRSFIAERAGLLAKGIQLGLAEFYFGCRHPDHDYLYRPELEAWEKQGAVQMVPCFSRPGGTLPKRHVHDAIWDDRVHVWEMIGAGAVIYVCGSAAKLGRSVHNTMKRIYMTKTEKSEKAADEWLDELKTAGQYLRDIY